ncbi:thioredoxin reductase [Bradyrhizobium sp. USDA 4501]
MADLKCFDVAIIGAGPAGMSAALECCRNDLSVVVFDEQGRAGGQIFRQPPPHPSVQVNSPACRLYPFGDVLVRKAEAESRIDWRFRQTVWGIFPDEDRIRVCTNKTTVLARKTLVATGAYEMPVAFPGWTLPGVMGVGAIQTLLRSQNVLLGRRFVLAGSHPLLILVADMLLAAGAEIQEVAIARSRPRFREILDGLLAVPGNIPIFKETASSLYKLTKARVSIRFGRIMVEARGNEEGLTHVTLSDCDRDWTPSGAHRVFETDILGTGFGSLPSNELCRQIGCATQWDSRNGGWIVKHDGFQRTTVRNVYVAGEPAGIRGAASARTEGELAGLMIVQDLIPQRRDDRLIRRNLSQTKRNRKFSDRVAKFFQPNMRALSDLASDGTVICRCEDVKRSAVTKFLERNSHTTSINSVKLACRTGMGFCQGRYCHHTLAQILSNATSQPVERCGEFTARVPIKPISARGLSDV